MAPFLLKPLCTIKINELANVNGAKQEPICHLKAISPSRRSCVQEDHIQHEAHVEHISNVFWVFFPQKIAPIYHSYSGHMTVT